MKSDWDDIDVVTGLVQNDGMDLDDLYQSYGDNSYNYWGNPNTITLCDTPEEIANKYSESSFPRGYTKKLIIVQKIYKMNFYIIA